MIATMSINDSHNVIAEKQDVIEAVKWDFDLSFRH